MIPLGNTSCIAVEFLTVSYFSELTEWSLPAAVSRKKSWYNGISDEKYYIVVVGWSFELWDGKLKSYATYRKDKKNCEKVSFKIILVF